MLFRSMNTSEASNSFSPCTLLKRALERIHISKGMLSIRVSVMELGRFTTRQAAGAGNHLDYAPLVSGTQWTEGLIPRGETGSRTVTGFAQIFRILPRRDEPGPIGYFAAGASLSAFDCFAMIMSLILS